MENNIIKFMFGFQVGQIIMRNEPFVEHIEFLTNSRHRRRIYIWCVVWRWRMVLRSSATNAMPHLSIQNNNASGEPKMSMETIVDSSECLLLPEGCSFYQQNSSKHAQCKCQVSAQQIQQNTPPYVFIRIAFYDYY